MMGMADVLMHAVGEGNRNLCGDTYGRNRTREARYVSCIECEQKLENDKTEEVVVKVSKKNLERLQSAAAWEGQNLSDYLVSRGLGVVWKGC